MRRATWLIKEESLHGKIMIQFRSEALGRETQLCCLFQNADFCLVSQKHLRTSNLFTVFAKVLLKLTVTFFPPFSLGIQC